MKQRRLPKSKPVKITGLGMGLLDMDYMIGEALGVDMFEIAKLRTRMNAQYDASEPDIFRAVIEILYSGRWRGVSTPRITAVIERE